MTLPLPESRPLQPSTSELNSHALLVDSTLMGRARACSARIWPTIEVFYTEPWVDMHNRMKEALVLLGKLPRAVVRPPLVKISDAEIARIRNALIEAELLDARAAQGRNAA